MFKLLGALAAVGVLAVAPSVASAAPPSAGAAEGGSGCEDNSAPSSRWGHTWWGSNGHGPYWRGWDDGDGELDGYSWDPGCDADHNGKVARVMIAVDRLRGSRCQHLSAGSQRLGRAGSCARPQWIRARGTSAWHYGITRRLARGRYRIHRRAVDAAGNRERARHMTLRIR